MDELTEVAYEVFLRPRVAGLQLLHVRFVKCMKLQATVLWGKVRWPKCIPPFGDAGSAATGALAVFDAVSAAFHCHLETLLAILQSKGHVVSSFIVLLALPMKLSIS